MGLAAVARCSIFTVAAQAAAFLVSAVAPFAPPAAAQPEDNITRANRGAYTASMKCFVVLGVLKGDAERDSKPDAALAYEKKARQSFDYALQLGEKLGLSGTHVEEDFSFAQSKELPKLLFDRSYFRAEAATCQALGLL